MAKKNSIRERAKKVPKHIKGFVKAVMQKGSTNFGEWQLCPKCLGEGMIPNIGITTSVLRQCDVCFGAKIITKPIIND